MDATLFIENDYYIQEKLVENGIDKSAMEQWLKPETTRKVDLFAAVKESVWKKSIYHHSSNLVCDGILFAHTQNHKIITEILQYFKRVLSPLEPKIETYQRHLWTPVSEPCGFLKFETRSQKTVSTAMGFLLVTSEFCEEEWPSLAGQPFFQEAMYNKNVTIVPILVHNPKKVKYKIPMGIKSLRSIEFYNKDDILCQESVINILQPVVKKRMRNEKDKLKNDIEWLYQNVIRILPSRQNGDIWLSNQQWYRKYSSPTQKTTDSEYMSNDHFHNASQPFDNFHSSRAKKSGSTHHESAPDSAYVSNESIKSNPIYHDYEMYRNTSRYPVEHSSPNVGEEVTSRMSNGHSFREDNVSLSRSKSSKSYNSPSPISITEAPDLNFSSMESSASEPPKHQRLGTIRSEYSPKYSSATSNARHGNITGVQVQSSKRNKPEALRNNEDGKVSTNTNSKGRHESNIPEINVSFDKKVPNNLPVAIEVECRSFGTMSSQDPSSTPRSRAQDTSSFHESDLSNQSIASSSVRHDSETMSAQTTCANKNHLQEAWNNLPNPILINTNTGILSLDMSTNLSSNHSSRSVDGRNRTSMSCKIVDHNQHSRVHPQAQPISSFPSGEINFSISSHESAFSGESYRESSRNSVLSSSNISSTGTSSARKTTQNPLPQKISLKSFPSEGEMSKDLDSKIPFTPVTDVTQLAFGCLRPSDSFKDQYHSRSFTQSELDSARPVGVVRPFSMQEDDDEDDNEFSNDLSLPRTMSEETYVKRS